MATQRPKIDPIWSSTGEVTDPADKYVEGWLYKEKPEHQHQNYLQQQEELFYKSTTESGIPVKGIDVTYPVNALVHDDDKVQVQYESGKWTQAVGGMTRADVEDIMSDISDQGYPHYNDKTNPHEVTTEQLGIYTKDEVDDKYLEVKLALDTHKGDIDNPHNVTTDQLQALRIDATLIENQFSTMAKLITGKGSLSFDASKVIISAGLRGFGVSSDQPVSYYNGEVDLLMHEGNYKLMRNVLEPEYASSTPDVEIPLSCDLTSWYGDPIVKLSQDIAEFTKEDGLVLKGSMEIKTANCAGSTFSLNVKLFGDVEFYIGNTKVYDATAWNSVFTFVRDGLNFKVYNSTSEIVNTTLPSDIGTPDFIKFVSGGLNIKHMKIWSSVLTREQIAMHVPQYPAPEGDGFIYDLPLTFTE